MKRILLVISSRTYRVGEFIAAADKLGLEITIASDQEHVFASLQPESHLRVDFSDAEGAADIILEFSREYPLAAVLAAEDEGAETAAIASMALGLSHSSLTAVSAARNKAAMRQILAEAGLNSPKYWVFKVIDGPENASQQVAYPCVLKPLFLSGSRGVIRANHAEEFSAAFRQIEEILALPGVKEQGGALADQILVEEYISGEEISQEGLLVDGDFIPLVLFDKPDPLDGPYFEETIYVTPSRHPSAVRRTAMITSQLACDALGLTQGPVHIEMRLNENGATIIEIAPRSIGGYCSKAAQFGTGRTLEEVILRNALGQEHQIIRRENGAAGVMMIPIPGEGTLKKVAGVSKAEAVSGIEEIIITIKPGQSVVPLPKGSQYLGFIIARAETPEKVEKALRLAHSKIKFTLQGRA